MNPCRMLLGTWTRNVDATFYADVPNVLSFSILKNWLDKFLETKKKIPKNF